MADELLVLLIGSRPDQLNRCCFPGTGLFGYDHPRNNIDDDTDADRQEGDGNPDQPDYGRIDIQVFPKAGTDPAEHPVPCTAIEPLHAER